MTLSLTQRLQTWGAGGVVGGTTTDLGTGGVVGGMTLRQTADVGSRRGVGRNDIKITNMGRNEVMKGMTKRKT